MANRAILTGRLTADPELRQTKSDIPVTNFSIAVPRKYKKDEVDFIDIVAWRYNAEFLCKYFTKGKWVEIDGSIQTQMYEDKDGIKRKAVEILADEVNFVGTKPKDGEADSAEHSAPPPPPKVDPFAKSAPTYTSSARSGYQELDDDGDLPF